ncbi:hypothetical protein NQ315_004456, partial [Exocentrus adspersus]
MKPCSFVLLVKRIKPTFDEFNIRMFALILLTALGAFLVYYFIVKPYRYWTDRGVKQGNPIWLFGDNWDNIIRKESIAGMVTRLYNQFPGCRYSGIYQFLTPTLLVRDLDLIKQITVKDFDHFTDHRPFLPQDTDPLWSKNLVALNGDKWRDMRTILSPSFTSSKMRSIFVIIQECAENFVKHFLDKNEDVVEIEFKDTFTRFTNDVIASTAFGIQVDSLGQPDNLFYFMGKEATDFSGFWRNFKILGFFIVPKLYEVTLFSKKVTKFFKKIVGDTLKLREEKGIVRSDMIQLLVEARKGKQSHDDTDIIDTGFSVAQESDLTKPSSRIKTHKELSDMDITAQAMIFLFGGFDTASGLMCFLAYELATNPDVQDKLRKEVRDTLEECEGKLTYESLLKMKYMDMVVSECLRKWPNAVVTDRICTKPYTIKPVFPEEKPVHLQKGDLILLPMCAIHHDPRYYPNPERFDPERFNDENKGKIKPYTYFPFGLGPRNCIGS